MGKRRKSKHSAPPRFDPGSLGDEVALTTTWVPCTRGGASFCTRTLDRDGEDRWRFRPTMGGVGFSLFFVGGGVISFGCWIATRFVPAPNVSGGVLLLITAIFGGVGGFMLSTFTEPIVFDLKQGIYWKGRGEPPMGSKTELSSVHALQIISEYVVSTDPTTASFSSYELNLVLENGDRINVVDHGDYERLRRDGRTLSEVLEIPLWDPT